MTTFAPASHDAERRDLPANPLAPPADGSPLGNGVANHSEQNGISQSAHSAAHSSENAPQSATMAEHLKANVQPAPPEIPVATAPAAEPAPALATEVAPALEAGASDSIPTPVAPSSLASAEVAGLAVPPASVPAPQVPEGPPMSSMRNEPAPAASIVAPDAVSAPIATSDVVAPKSESKDEEMVDAPPSKVSRGREDDDGGEEPSAKRVRVDDTNQAAAASLPHELKPELPLDSSAHSELPPSQEPTSSTTALLSSSTLPSPTKVPQPATQDTTSASISEPLAASMDTDMGATVSAPTADPAPAAAQDATNAPSAPADASASTEPTQPVQPTQPAQAAQAAQPSNGVSAYVAPEVEDFGPMTDLHKKRLIEGMRNLKKSKHANAFAKPVDPDALNLPTYREIVTNPMDLATMESKLRGDQYGSVNDYVKDFDLMVANAIAFNSQAHPVAQAGQILRSQLTSQLGKLAQGAGSTAGPARKGGRDSLNMAPRETRPRVSAGGAGGSPVAPLDGNPIIRRGSNLDDKTDRPKRKIQKPAPRDLSYAKTPKKKFQAELKFAEEVLTEMERPRYNTFSAPFLQPVDPIALSIPTYFKIIKKPMDVSTVRDKLNKHEYENLREFESDFHLIFANCMKFNPKGSPVYGMAQEYQKVFDAEMAKKDTRMAVLAPASAVESPVADSDEDESDDEEDEEEQLRMEKIRALNEQVAAIQQQAAELMSGNWAKSSKGASSKAKGGKSGGGTKRKSSSGAAAAGPSKKTAKVKVTPAPKKAKPLTSAQKQEIADHIGELAPEEIGRVAEQIKASLRKAGKAVPADDDLEFQIDDIPDELLHELLGKVRQNTSVRNRDDDETRGGPAAGRGAGQRSKKNKPMSKSEQEAQINRLEGQLATFQNGGAGGEQMFASGQAQDDSSDDMDSGSESEEE